MGWDEWDYFQRERSIRRLLRRFPSHGCTLMDCWPASTRRLDGHATYGEGDALGTGEIYIHRIIWTYLFGPIPNGVLINQVCGRKNCANPLHLLASDQGVEIMKEWYLAKGARHAGRIIG